jgi:hypothetical protein
MPVSCCNANLYVFEFLYCMKMSCMLSCMLAALAGVKCVLAAREAMDGHHQLMRETPASVLDPKVTEEVHAFAANSVEATAMLDDASCSDIHSWSLEAG